MNYAQRIGREGLLVADPEHWLRAKLERGDLVSFERDGHDHEGTVLRVDGDSVLVIDDETRERFALSMGEVEVL